MGSGGCLQRLQHASCRCVPLAPRVGCRGMLRTVAMSFATQLYPQPQLCTTPHVQVLAAGRVEQLAETFGIGAGLAGGGASAPRASGEAAGPQCMALDGAALENLEVCMLAGADRSLQCASHGWPGCKRSWAPRLDGLHRERCGG